MECIKDTITQNTENYIITKAFSNFQTTSNCSHAFFEPIEEVCDRQEKREIFYWYSDRKVEKLSFVG